MRESLAQGTESQNTGLLSLCHNIFRKLSSQQKELITQFARMENLTSGTVNGVSFEQEEGQWGQKYMYFMHCIDLTHVVMIMVPILKIVWLSDY